jgi:hypothetical protein
MNRLLFPSMTLKGKIKPKQLDTSGGGKRGGGKAGAQKKKTQTRFDVYLFCRNGCPSLRRKNHTTHTHNKKEKIQERECVCLRAFVGILRPLERKNRFGCFSLLLFFAANATLASAKTHQKETMLRE